jgi:hypothetical protein
MSESDTGNRGPRRLAYLGHGDQGLAANIKMALLFTACGGVVTLVWFAIARSLMRR